MIDGLKPKEIVEKLDEFIIGQKEAKKSVAIALRNRIRRHALKNDPIQEEIYPKNIIMIGPTGVGKTEIARRLAKIENAPFIKVEATKYTEVGYVGRDVESMIRDLVSTALKMVKSEQEEKIKEKAEKKAEERLLDLLIGDSEKPSVNQNNQNISVNENNEDKEIRDLFRKKLIAGQLEDKEVELSLPSRGGPMMQIMAVPGLEEMENQMRDILGDIMPKKNKNRKIQVRDARKILIQEELENMLDHEKIKLEAVSRVENSGIVFIDEIDKITSRSSGGNVDVSREGVQRDILPLVEGSTVNTRHGSVKTDHILFIAAGAFHMASVSDLIPELQGRFPIRVELKSLEKEDFIKILTSPKNALTKQYQALLSTESVALRFEKDGIEKIAEIAYNMNIKNENIGARRLHTIMERLLEDVSYNAENYVKKEVLVNAQFVDKNLKDIIQNEDLTRYIL